jgi:hypothetical protein
MKKEFILQYCEERAMREDREFAVSSKKDGIYFTWEESLQNFNCRSFKNAPEQNFTNVTKWKT